MDVYVTECAVRNPFRTVSLPLAACLYRYRKGAFRRRTLGQKLLRALTPSNLFLRGVLGLAGQRSRGRFAFCRGGTSRQIAFRVANTQFHALYFPQYEGGYEPETSCLVDMLLAANPHAVFYDVGANWGYFSLWAASSPGFAGRVRAFEPFPATYADLQDVVRQAGLEEIVECHEVALADENRAGTMCSHDGVTSGTASVSATTSGTSMRLATLDSLSGPLPDVMKVDVEGFEAEVFVGASHALSNSRPMIIFESWLDAKRLAKTLRPFRILQRHGYRFFEPALLCGEGSERHLVGFCKSGVPDDRRGLGLAEFVPEQRSLLGPHFNVFACHDSKCDEFLDANFERLSTELRAPGLRLVGTTSMAG